MTTRSQSVAELEKRVEENRTEANSRMDQMQTALENRMEELRTLIISQRRGPSEESFNGGPRQTPAGTEQIQIPASPNQQNQQRNYSTRISKVDFPKFDGKKVKDWLYKCDQFFLLDETPPESRVRLASIHLEGLALQWHLNYMRGRFDQYPLWPQYSADVKRRFGDLYDDPLAELIQVKHTNSVQSYIDEFELAHTQVSIFPEQALSIFLAGLEPSTQAQVRMFNPANLHHAANLAKLCETARPKQNNYKQPYQNQKPQTQATKNNQSPFLPNPSQKLPPPKTYSKSQLEERSAKGLCWYCDEPYSPAHRLTHKGKHTLMMMEVDDDEEPSETTQPEPTLDPVLTPVSENEMPQISMQAMSGLYCYQTMRVKGWYV